MLQACDVIPSGFSRFAFSMILMISAVALNLATFPEFRQFSTSSTYKKSCQLSIFFLPKRSVQLGNVTEKKITLKVACFLFFASSTSSCSFFLKDGCNK